MLRPRKKTQKVKRWAVPLRNKRNYERVLLEECTMAQTSIKEPLLKPCLLDTVQASAKVVAALRAYGCALAESALTGRIARVQSKSITVGDVVLYLGDGHSDI